MSEPEPLELVEGLLEILKGTSIAELEVEFPGVKVRLHREVLGTFVAPSGPPDASLLVPAAPDDGPAEVTSAYVGTFRHGADDQLPAVGDEVAAGTRIAEIEVLGIRNSVVAPIDGVLAALLVEDDTPVEYGQPLAVIDPKPPAAP